MHGAIGKMESETRPQTKRALMMTKMKMKMMRKFHEDAPTEPFFFLLLCLIIIIGRAFRRRQKFFRAAPTATNTTAAVTPWKAPDEMIGVSVPRKARSASTKRSHECWNSSGGVGSEQIPCQASISPVRSSGPAMLASASPAAPVSPPSSSNASVKKKMKPNGTKQRPPKSSSKSTSAQDEIEFEIAEVLYGLLRQPQGATKQEIMGNDSIKFDFREANHNKTTSDAKSRVSSPISNSQSTVPQSSSIPPSNSSSSAAPMSAIAPKRKRPRPVKYDDEHPTNFPARNSSILSIAKVDVDQPARIDSSPNLENSGSAAENGGVSHDLLSNQAAPAMTEAQLQEAVKLENHPISDSKPTTEGSECRDLGGLIEETRSPKKESTPSLRLDDDCESLTANKANLMVSEIDCQQEEKFQIDLMAPPSSSSPERDRKEACDGQKDEKALKVVKEDINVEPVEKKTKVTGEEVESQKPLVNKERNIDLQLDLGKADRDSATVTTSRNKLLQHVQPQPNTEKIAQSSSLPLPMSMTGWPVGFLTWGIVFWVLFDSFILWPYNALDSLLWGNDIFVSADIWHLYKELYPWMEAPCLLQPYSQPRPKRCATHCYIARNIHCYQQFTRMNPFWPPAAGSALQYGAKACNMNVVPSADLHAGRGFPGPKNQLPHSLPHQQRQQMQSQTVSPQARQLESELGGEDSPSTADSQVSRPNTSLYGQNLMPIHPANFALMNPTPMGGAHSASGNTKPRQPQTQVSKAGAEPSASQAFAMSFTSINGTTASRDLIFFNCTESCSSPKPPRGSKAWISLNSCCPSSTAEEELPWKTGGNDTSNVEEERKAITGVKAPLTAGQSIVFFGQI
ncbi:LOW QUALITY PROTEIN: protein TIME FORFFEE-like isoform X3 [Populus alba x Populus x berolinensis]|uniref:Protein TIME FORFFEE-like isoform X3 n=1 Tax=Populus alba x Populus x berolinensis TaxID=444605 RepID=A0AAD6Q6B5_9ROSI|nr:LOW QUALITY PROTEIN: protein TIME FORFFEE-like isoform X3 [Populus alba x Populus x berolinensis]